MSAGLGSFHDRNPLGSTFHDRLPRQDHQNQHQMPGHVRRHSEYDSTSRYLHQRYQHGHANWAQRPQPQYPESPLINKVTNEWQHGDAAAPQKFPDGRYGKDKHDFYYDDDEDEVDYDDPDDDDCIRDCWSSFLCTRRVRRYLCAYFLFLTVTFYYWTYHLKPDWQENRALDNSLARQRPKQDFFANARPQFADMIQLQQLDSRLLPGLEDATKSRLVVVGDVHGCKEELMKLLDKVNFSKETDHLILTGDIIYKGPDSAGVIDFARSVGASCVRGNHEDRTLLAASSLRNIIISVDPPKKGKGQSKKRAAMPDNVATKGFASHAELANSLTQDQLSYLRSCPIILDVGKILDRHYVVVHGGLVPGVPLDRQDPYHVMNMRTIDLDTRVPTETRAGEPWYNVWNHYQKVTKKHESDRITVIYGHDAKGGLTIKPHTKGLDSGCVGGGQLSALVIDDKGKETVVSIPCPEENVVEDEE